MATLPINKGHIPYALAQIFALRKQSCRGDEVADEGSWNTTAVEVFKDDCTAEGRRVRSDLRYLLHNGAQAKSSHPTTEELLWMTRVLWLLYGDEEEKVEALLSVRNVETILERNGESFTTQKQKGSKQQASKQKGTKRASTTVVILGSPEPTSSSPLRCHPQAKERRKRLDRTVEAMENPKSALSFSEELGSLVSSVFPTSPPTNIKSNPRRKPSSAMQNVEEETASNDLSLATNAKRTYKRKASETHRLDEGVRKTSQPPYQCRSSYDSNHAGSSMIPFSLFATVPTTAKRRKIRPHPPFALYSHMENLIAKDRKQADNGISSRKFARVLRLVAGLSPPRSVPPTAKHPPPAQRPPVWAESRQELCEALPYYRAFQSGLYMRNRIAFGYLLEAFPAPRDIWARNGRVVISHGGGQCVRTTDSRGRKGEPALQADQASTDARVDTLLQAYHNRTPLILIAGQGYDGLPWRLPYAYAVLGWYWISAVWVEAEPVAKGFRSPINRNYFHRYKIRFDWVQSQGQPWWNSKDQAWALHESCSNLRHEVNPTANLFTPPTPPDEVRDIETTSSLGRGMTIAQMAPSSARLFTPLFTPTILKDRIAICSLVDVEEVQSAKDLRVETVDDCARENILESRSPHDFSSDDETDDDGWSGSCFSGDELALPPQRSLPGTRYLRSAEKVASSDDFVALFAYLSRPCPSCLHTSPQIYMEGWTCLDLSCPQFWLLATPIGLLPIPPGFKLSYSSHWLECAPTPPGLESVPYSVIPAPPGVSLSEVAENAGGRELWKGWVCGDCGRANCRYRWEVWECRNCGNMIAQLDPNAVISASILEPEVRPFLGDAYIDPNARIQVHMGILGTAGIIVMVYTLPRGSGTIHHLLPYNKRSADKAWEMYQREAAAMPVPTFERKALQAGLVKGQLLAQQFAINSGAPYKYNVDSASLSFEDSPSSVRIARDMISDGVEAVLGERVNFNEVLSVMYREGQKMSWHDDGEEGLGPVVASLSLGSTATMSFRPKVTRQQVNKTYYFGHQTIPKKAVVQSTALSLTLSHGNIVVMQGEKIQTRYSHRVIPHGFRVAATAREIG